MKTERLKKLENELRDLQQWLKLGLVPKKDLPRHEDEIRSLQSKIEEERERMRFLKETGDLEEYYASRKAAAGRSGGGYPEGPSMADIELEEPETGMTEESYDMDTEAIDTNTTAYGEEDEEEAREGGGRGEEEGETTSYEEEEEEEEEEDLFTDKKWRRGVLDPDEDEW